MNTPQITYIVGVLLILAAAVFVYMLFSSQPRYAAYETQCASLVDEKNLISCWQNVIKSLVIEKSFKEAFSFVGWLYAHNHIFASNCYTVTRAVGGELFGSQPDYAEFDFTQEGAYCNYGFFHGYATEVAQVKGALVVKDFCNRAYDTLAQKVPAIRNECFRGAGRGLLLRAFDGASTAHAVVDRAIIDCTDIAPTTTDKNSCIAGVYNWLGVELGKDAISFPDVEQFPLHLCTGEYAPICVGNFKWAFTHEYVKKLTVDNLPVLYEEIRLAHCDDEQCNSAAVWVLAYMLAGKTVTEQSHAFHIQNCAALGASPQGQCVQGFALGLAKNGFPKKEYVAVLNFCTEVLRSDLASVARTCPQAALEWFKGLYDETKFNHVCSLFAQQFGLACTDIKLAESLGSV